MGWEIQERLSVRNVTGIRFSSEASKYPRTKIRFGHDVLKFLNAGKGDHVVVLYDHGARRIGFQKGTKETGFQLTGKHSSQVITFATPKNKHLDLLLAAYDKDFGFEADGDIAVVKVKASTRGQR